MKNVKKREGIFALNKKEFEEFIRVDHVVSQLGNATIALKELSGYHADTPITIKAEAFRKADSRSN